MLQTVNANEGRTSWRMKAVLLIGGLAVLALPAVYLSRASAVQAEDPPQAVDAPKADRPTPDDRPKPFIPFTAVSEPSVEFLPEPSQSEKLILAAFNRQVTLNFVEQPLIKVVAFLEDVLEQKVPIQLDYRALEDAGVGADTPVTRTVKDVKLRTALKLLLSEHDLTYLISDDVMLITTMDRADVELFTRTYPVADLLEVAAEPRTAPTGGGGVGAGQFQVADKPAATPQAAATPGSPVSQAAPAAEPVAAAESAPKGLHGVGGGGVSGGGVSGGGFGGGGVPAAKSGSQRARDAREHNPDSYDTLIETIMTTVKPQTWDEVGGPGSITAVPVARSLVISQTRDVHDEILDLIRSLRAAKRASNAKASDD